MMSTLVSCVPRFSHHDLLLFVVFLLCFFMCELADVGTGRRHKESHCKWLSVAFHRPRSSVWYSEFSLRMLVSRHLCNVVLTGAPVAPDLRSAADPGADRSLSLFISTIAETVTLLRERILLVSPYKRQHGIIFLRVGDQVIREIIWNMEEVNTNPTF